MDISLGATLAMLRKEKKLMQKTLAEKLSHYGFSVAPKTIYNWEKELSQPSIPIFLALCDILDVDDVLWQFASIGRGPYAGLNSDGRRKAREFIDLLHYIEMYKVTGSESGDNLSAHAVSARENSAVNSTPRAGKNTKSAAPAYNTGYIHPPRVLRLYDIPVSAGAGNFLDESGWDEIEAPSYVPASAGFALRLSGDSMEPLMADGQIIWVKEQQVLSSGEIGIFTYSGNVYCKKLIADGKKVLLRSLNPLYSDIEIKEDFGFKVLGKVMC